ncbi:MAG: SDR family oxidoreductase [Planctomycetaceae bacterium]
MEIAGARALVTGGARRIGRALCRALAERGARVAIHCRTSLTEAHALARDCPGSVVLPADLTTAAACESLVDEARSRLGGIEILVNNAAVYERAPLGEVDEACWDRTLALNLKAPFFCSRAAGMTMRQGGGGVIVNLGDWAALRPYPGYLPYFASKAGLLALTAGMARELAPRVRVNGVAPGAATLEEGTPPDKVARVIQATPLGRLGGEESVVSAVLFLVDNDFVTGQTLTVDGGRSLR